MTQQETTELAVTAVKTGEVPNTNVVSLSFANVTHALQAVARDMANMSDEKVPMAYDFMNQLGKMADAVKDRVRERVLLYLSANGTQVTAKGTTEASIGGHLMRAVPLRTGIDPKKLEALLRTRGVEPLAGMDATIAYKVNNEKVNKLIAGGTLSPDDVQKCSYDKSYRVEIERERTNE